MSTPPVVPQFQGIAVARRLHFVSQILNVVFWIFVLLSVFAEGEAGMIVAALIFCPVMLIVYAMLIRLLSEMAVSVLLIPPLLAKHQPGAGVASAPAVDDADLAAYGVGGTDMGAVV